MTLYVVCAGVALLSIGPVINMLSPRQMMNASFEPLHLVNTYGAFGSITRERYEIVLEGTDDASVNERTKWREYEFKGKPGDPARRPPQVAPYHLRLDWLMWFEAMAPAPHSDWFFSLLAKLLQEDRGTLSLLRTNPFPNAPPKYLRAQYYLYKFTTPDDHRRNGQWWTRQLIGTFYGPVSLGPR
jgi:lipase maturation factor